MFGKTKCCLMLSKITLRICIFCIFLISQLLNSAYAQTGPQNTLMDLEGLPFEDIMKGVDAVSPILYDIIVTDLVYAINESQKGVYLVCRDHLSINDDLGLMDGKTSYNLGNLFISSLIQEKYIKREMEKVSNSLSRSPSPGSLRNSLFIRSPAVCKRSLVKIIAGLPSIKVNPNLGVNVIIIPWYGTYSGYLMSFGKDIVIAVNIDMNSVRIEEAISREVKPLVDIDDNSLNQIVMDVSQSLHLLNEREK